MIESRLQLIYWLTEQLATSAADAVGRSDRISCSDEKVMKAEMLRCQ